MPEVIAECSTNHGGSVALAKEFIDAFSPYVDTVKFQLTRVAHLRAADPQYEWFTQAELTLDQFAELKAACEKAGVSFLLTVYNAADVWEVARLGCNRVKIGSGEAGEWALRREIAERGLHPIVSCGLIRPHRVDSPVLGSAIYLGCCTRYPAPQGLAAAYMRSGHYDGWSDHAVGLDELKAAICCGAKVVETHVQLPNQARPARSFEKTATEMAELRRFVGDNPKRFLGRWQA